MQSIFFVVWHFVFMLGVLCSPAVDLSSGALRIRARLVAGAGWRQPQPQASSLKIPLQVKKKNRNVPFSSEGIKDAFDYGVKVAGVTVHFVDDQMDHGPIILQEAVKIEEGDTLESLEAKIHKIEHKLYPEAIRLFIERKLKIEGRKVHPVR